MVINSGITYRLLLQLMRERFAVGPRDRTELEAFWERTIRSLRHYYEQPIPPGGEDYPYDDKGGWLPGREWLQAVEDGTVRVAEDGSLAER